MLSNIPLYNESLLVDLLVSTFSISKCLILPHHQHQQIWLPWSLLIWKCWLLLSETIQLDLNNKTIEKGALHIRRITVLGVGVQPYDHTIVGGQSMYCTSAKGSPGETKSVLRNLWMAQNALPQSYIQRTCLCWWLNISTRGGA